MQRNVHLFTRTKKLREIATVKRQLLYMTNGEVIAAQLDQGFVAVFLHVIK